MIRLIFAALLREFRSLTLSFYLLLVPCEQTVRQF